MQEVEIQLMDPSGDVVYEETMGAVIKVEKRFDIAALERGTYQVVIRTPEKTFYESVRKD